MPGVPLENSTISLAAALAKPATRAMPSPTSATVPTSTMRWGAWKLSICWRIKLAKFWELSAI